MAEVPLLLYGASGRMGSAVREHLRDVPDIKLLACVAPQKPADASGVRSLWLTPDELSKSGARDGLPDDVVILDVSLAAGTTRLAEILAGWPRALVAASTGLDAETEGRLKALGGRIPVLRAPNLSLGNAIAQRMLRAIPPAALRSFTVKIVERHHVGKKDSPSGTAFSLAQILKAMRGEAGLTGDVSIESIREGSVPGTHQVILTGAGETLEIIHTAHDRSVFALGALGAVRFLHGRAPGTYTIEDVLRET